MFTFALSFLLSNVPLAIYSNQKNDERKERRRGKGKEGERVEGGEERGVKGRGIEGRGERGRRRIRAESDPVAIVHIEVGLRRQSEVLEDSCEEYFHLQLCQVLTKAYVGSLGHHQKGRREEGRGEVQGKGKGAGERRRQKGKGEGQRRQRGISIEGQRRKWRRRRKAYR